MAADHTKITTAFRDFNNAIKVPDDKLNTVNYRLNRIVAALDKYYYGEEQKKSHFRIGSIGRQTDIHTSDVDIIYKVPASLYKRYDTYAGNGQSKMLQDLRSAILGTYSTTYVKGDGLVAVVSFSDDIVFEIMPGIERNDYSFTYPITKNGGSWGMTNPLPEIAAMDEIQRESAHNARKLARMARAWKEYNGVSMGGLLYASPFSKPVNSRG